MALYSWMGLPIQIEMTDENAAAYNRVGDAVATIDSSLPVEDIQMVAQPADVEVWNKVADLINTMIELNGGGLPYTEKDMTTGRNHMVPVTT